MFTSQCIVRATVIGFAGTMSGHVSAPLLESSENVLTDAVRLQVCCSVLCILWRGLISLN